MDSLTQGHCTGSSFGPVGAANSIEGSGGFGHAADQVQFSLSVCPARGARTTKGIRDKHDGTDEENILYYRQLKSEVYTHLLSDKVF